MAEPMSEKVNIYQELRALRAEIPPQVRGSAELDGDKDLLLDSPWLRACLGCAVLWLLLAAVEAPDLRPAPWLAAIAMTARDPVAVSVVVWLACWTGQVAEAKGQSRLRYTLWALLTPGVTSILIISKKAAEASPRCEFSGETSEGHA